MTYKTIIEGGVKVLVPKETKISKDLPVFYNPAMIQNRDIAVAVIGALKRKISVCDPLAGSGVRAIRLLRETKNIKSISINDNSQASNRIIKKNLAKNKLKTGRKIKVSNSDANQFLLNSRGFDYIDIDPFGSPNPFLDASIKRISRNGILAVTATDTAALCGTSPDAARRKYWGEPLHSHLMHEVGLRLLMRKVQLIGAQYEKALTPILSYWHEHYFRAYFECTKGKKAVDKILANHQYIGMCKECLSMSIAPINAMDCCNIPMIWAGPVWCGKIKDQEFVNSMQLESSLFTMLKKEYDTTGFFDVHVLAHRLKLPILPTMEKVMEKLHDQNYTATRTQFSTSGLKTNAPLEVIKEILTSQSSVGHQQLRRTGHGEG